MYASSRQNTLDRPLRLSPNDTRQKKTSNSVPISSEIQNTISSLEEKLADYQTKEKVVVGENEQSSCRGKLTGDEN